MTDKELIIVSGANGSGKTTFAIPYVEQRGYEFLNADEIAKDLQRKGVSNVMIKAGRLFFQRLQSNLNKEKSFVVETTLSGTYINKVANKAKKEGFKVKTIYIFLDNAELCVQRVRTRVLKGGHDVPTEDVIRRYYRSKENFWNEFVHLSDEWIMLYNGEDGFQEVAIGTNESFTVINEILFEKFKIDLL